jgi:2-polyprenyl-3-methyl-5-hydroxy-6-metoxy-1,4-benzoquinol methylase
MTISPTPKVNQSTSGGTSTSEIHSAVMARATPTPGLRWADIGCGTGEDLRQIRDHYSPASLIGSDLLCWLPDDLSDIQFLEGDAVWALDQVDTVDRLLMVETIEHLEAPWAALRTAARKVAPSGLLIVTTPNVRSLRHRLDLLVRGNLTSFRPDNVAHLTPVLPHIARRILDEEGMQSSVFYSSPDVIPFTGGKRWLDTLARRCPSLLYVSLGIVAWRDS